MFIGFFLLALGLLFLLRNLNIIDANLSDMIWPILLIAFGASIIFKRKSKQEI